MDEGAPPSTSAAQPWYQRGLAQVSSEILGRLADSLHEGLIGGKAAELVSRQRREHLGGFLADNGPAFRVDPGEQVSGLGVPAPAQVAGKLSQRADRLGQDGADAEATDSLHDREA
jgi:hypothetical protein